MNNPLTLKLAHAVDLTDEDRRILADVARLRRHVSRRQDIIHDGDPPDDVHLVIDGLACRYKITPDGQRQIIAPLVPGDIFSLDVEILDEMDHAVASLSPCTVADIRCSTIHDIRQNPRIAEALQWSILVEEAILREWIVGLGRRDARTRLAHLLCELHVRMQAVGLVKDGCFPLPLTQQDLADALGLTTVHVNRMLLDLRESGLVTVKSRQAIVHDPERLRGIAAFSPAYLHLDKRRPICTSEPSNLETLPHLAIQRSRP